MGINLLKVSDIKVRGIVPPHPTPAFHEASCLTSSVAALKFGINSNNWEILLKSYPPVKIKPNGRCK